MYYAGTWLIPVSPLAVVIYVPTNYPTIQSAIDASSDGDEIIVSPGTYKENIHFKSKNIILRSMDPTNPAIVASTIIDGGGAGSVVTFSGPETGSCILAGFTLTKGKARNGGGINGNWTRATIQNNIITNNTVLGDFPGGCGGGLFSCNGIIQNNIISSKSAQNTGGGLYDCNGTIQNNIINGNSAKLGGGLASCHVTIQNNTISGNSASWNGGGIYGCHATIQNNTISGNSADKDGGGLASCYGTIQNNTIYGNLANWRGGGLGWCNCFIINCIIWGNSATEESQIYLCKIPFYSCIQDWTGGGIGNISLNPKLADPENGDFHLLSDSPCIDAGCLISDLLTDFEGDPRGYNGTSEPRGDGSDYDIGADEYIGVIPPPTPTPTPLFQLPNFTFEYSEENWASSGRISPYDQAFANWGAGSLWLNAMGLANCFGYWFSPDVAIEDGKLYRARWTVGSDASEPDKTAGFRLRINQRGSWAGWDRVVNSYIGQAPSAGNPKTYDLYFDPVVAGVNDDHLVIFSFDLTSFDISDDANSSLYLEELMVEEVSSQ